MWQTENCIDYLKNVFFLLRCLGFRVIQMCFCSIHPSRDVSNILVKSFHVFLICLCENKGRSTCYKVINKKGHDNYVNFVNISHQKNCEINSIRRTGGICLVFQTAATNATWQSVKKKVLFDSGMEVIRLRIMHACDDATLLLPGNTGRKVESRAKA